MDNLFLKEIILYSNSQIKKFSDGSTDTGKLNVQIKIKKNLLETEGLCVLIYNTYLYPYELSNGIRQSDIVSKNDESIIIKGKGYSGNGIALNKFGATIKICKNEITGFVFHYFDKGIDQEFILKAEAKIPSFISICEEINDEFLDYDENTIFSLAKDLITNLANNFNENINLLNGGVVKYLSKTLAKLTLDYNIRNNIEIYNQICNYAYLFYNKTCLLEPSLENNQDEMLLMFSKNSLYYRELIENFFIPFLLTEHENEIIHKNISNLEFSKIIYWLIEAQVLNLHFNYPHWNNVIQFHKNNLENNQYFPTTVNSVYKDSKKYQELFVSFLYDYIHTR